MEDRDIVDLYWARSQSAVKETAKKYGKLLYKLSFNVLRVKEDCEEAVNDSYLAAWDSMPENRPDDLCAYMCRITRNLSIKKLRFNKAEKRNSEFDICIDELAGLLPSSQSVENSFDAENAGRLISRFLLEQDEQTRNIFLRRFWFFDTPDEIARTFGMKSNTVRSVLYRTRLKLSDYLKGEGVDL